MELDSATDRGTMTEWGIHVELGTEMELELEICVEPCSDTGTRTGTVMGMDMRKQTAMEMEAEWDITPRNVYDFYQWTNMQSRNRNRRTRFTPNLQFMHL